MATATTRMTTAEKINAEIAGLQYKPQFTNTGESVIMYSEDPEEYSVLSYPTCVELIYRACNGLVTKTNIKCILAYPSHETSKEKAISLLTFQTLQFLRTSFSCPPIKHTVRNQRFRVTHVTISKDDEAQYDDMFYHLKGLNKALEKLEVAGLHVELEEQS
jgi:hypothetical protein